MAFKLVLVRAADFSNMVDAFVQKLVRKKLWFQGIIRYCSSLCYCTVIAALMRQFMVFMISALLIDTEVYVKLCKVCTVCDSCHLAVIQLL